MSKAWTTPASLNSHQLVPWCSQLPLYKQQCGHRTKPLQIARFLETVPRKKLSDIVNFLKSLKFSTNHHTPVYQMMQLKMHGFWAILYICQEMVPKIQQPRTLFLQLGDWRRPHGPLSGSTSHPSIRLATFQWHSCMFPSGRLAGAHNQSGPRSGGKSYCNRKVAEVCFTNQPIPSPARLGCTYGVFLGTFSGWPYGATTTAVLQQFLFSRRRGAVQGTGKFKLFVKIFWMSAVGR
jgi:hypothetical protein